MTLGKTAWWLITFGVTTWVGILALVYLGQRHLQYVPFGGEVEPQAVGFKGFSASRLSRPDGASVVVWSAEPAPGQPTVLYFHGNGGGLQHRGLNFAYLRSAGWGVTAMSYRSFSGSTGTPNEAMNISDAVAVYDTVRASGVAAGDIVVFGESIGTGVAIQVAAQRPVRSIVLEAPYSSVADVAADRFPFLPVRSLIRDPYVSVNHVQRVTAPILILHGTQDTVIPIRFGKRLIDAIPGPKRFVEYAGGGHSGLLELGGWNEIKAWVEQSPH